MFAPTFLDALKSNGVLLTLLISPVGIKVESTGKNESEFMISSCSNIVPSRPEEG